MPWHGLFCRFGKPIGPYPSMHVSELPDPLRSVWKELKPEMNEMSHCAAAFDSHSDGEKWHFAAQFTSKCQPKASVVPCAIARKSVQRRASKCPVN